MAGAPHPLWCSAPICDPWESFNLHTAANGNVLIPGTSKKKKNPICSVALATEDIVVFEIARHSHGLEEPQSQETKQKSRDVQRHYPGSIQNTIFKRDNGSICNLNWNMELLVNWIVVGVSWKHIFSWEVFDRSELSQKCLSPNSLCTWKPYTVLGGGYHCSRWTVGRTQLILFHTNSPHYSMNRQNHITVT